MLGNKIVLKHLLEQTPFHDSLRLHYSYLFGGTQQTTNTSAFDNLKSIGFDLIRNDQLRRNITTLYSEEYRILHSQEVDFLSKVQLNNISNEIHGKVIIDELWKSAYPIDIVSLRDDEEFKGMVRMNTLLFGFALRLYENAEAHIVDLTVQIDGELKKRNNDTFI